MKILTGVLVHRVTRPLRGSVSCGSGQLGMRSRVSFLADLLTRKPNKASATGRHHAGQPHRSRNGRWAVKRAFTYLPTMHRSRDDRWVVHAPATAQLLSDLHEPCAGHENVLLGLRPPVLCSVLATFLLNAGAFAHSSAPPRARLIGALLLGVRCHARQRRRAKVCLKGTSHGCGAGSEARGV